MRARSRTSRISSLSLLFLFLALRDHALGGVGASSLFPPPPSPPLPPYEFSLQLTNVENSPGQFYLPTTPSGCQHSNPNSNADFRMGNAYTCTWEGTVATGQEFSQLTLRSKSDESIVAIDAYEYMAISVNGVQVIKAFNECTEPVINGKCRGKGRSTYWRHVFDTPLIDPTITIFASSRQFSGNTHMRLKFFYLWFIPSPPPTPPPSPPPLSCERVASATLPENPFSHFTMRTPPLLGESGAGTWADVSRSGTEFAIFCPPFVPHMRSQFVCAAFWGIGW